MEIREYYIIGGGGCRAQPRQVDEWKEEVLTSTTTAADDVEYDAAVVEESEP